MAGLFGVLQAQWLINYLALGLDASCPIVRSFLAVNRVRLEPQALTRLNEAAEAAIGKACASQEWMWTVRENGVEVSKFYKDDRLVWLETCGAWTTLRVGVLEHTTDRYLIVYQLGWTDSHIDEANCSGASEPLAGRYYNYGLYDREALVAHAAAAVTALVPAEPHWL